MTRQSCSHMGSKLPRDEPILVEEVRMINISGMVSYPFPSHGAAAYRHIALEVSVKSCDLLRCLSHHILTSELVMAKSNNC